MFVTVSEQLLETMDALQKSQSSSGSFAIT